MTNKELVDLKEIVDFVCLANKTFKEGKLLVGFNIAKEAPQTFNKYDKQITPEVVRYLLEDLLAHREVVGDDYEN